MKKPIKSSGLFLVWIVLCAPLLSFTTLPGGDTYEIYLGSKLLLQQRVWMQKEVPVLALDAGVSQGQLSISYNHCGKTGTGRSVTLKDSHNTVLKEWRFANAPDGTQTPMSLKVKELMEISRSSNPTLNLSYASKELPEGRILATVRIGSVVSTASNE
jgi:hypothetical protein